MLRRTDFLGAVRRRTLICWRRARFSASSAALDRNRPTSARQSSLQRSHIEASIARFAIARQPDKIYDRDTGLNMNDLLAGLSQNLPALIDQLTPSGRKAVSLWL